MVLNASQQACTGGGHQRYGLFLNWLTVNTACDVYLSGGILKNNMSFAVVCSWFKDIDFHCSLLKTGKRPMF